MVNSTSENELTPTRSMRYKNDDGKFCKYNDLHTHSPKKETSKSVIIKKKYYTFIFIHINLSMVKEF